MAGSNYEVNIKLNVRNINTQLSNLERRIKKLNDIAMGQKGVGKAALKTERDKLALATKTFRREQQITKEKAKQNKLENNTAKITKKAGVRPTSKIPLGPSSPLNFDSQGRMMPGRAKVKGDGVLSGALISGAFPMLFGQGPLGAAAGFGGSFIGGKLGGQTGGFAGGLVATALLTQIQQISQGLTELGKSMDMFGFNVTTVSKALGVSGTPTEEYLKVLERTQGKQAAFNESMKRMEDLVGKDGVEALRNFADGTQRLQNSISRFLTEIGAKAAKLLDAGSKGRATGLERSQLLADAKKSDDQQIIDLIASKGKNRNKNQRIDDLIAKRMQEINLNKQNLEIEETRAMKVGEMTKSVMDRTLLLQETLQFGAEEAGIREKMREFDEQAKKNGITILDTERKQYENALRLQPVLQKNFEIQKAMTDLIANNMGNAMKDLISGAQSFNDVMRNTLNNMASAFLNLGIFGNVGGSFEKGQGLLGRIFRAEGGPVKGGKSYVVGERGPEMFTPGVSGMITPNHALGGSTNVIVNVDASGSSVEGDEQQGRELGRLISVAVQSELVNQKRPGGLLA